MISRLLLTRFSPMLLLGASLLAPLPDASAAPDPMIQLIVPSYDYTPGRADSTLATAIADDYKVVGTYGNRRVPEDSYLRLANGHFGRPISVPGAIFTAASGINSAGLVCGTSISDAPHGFFFDGTTYTQYDLPGNVETNITGENNAGDFVGVANDGQGVRTNFINVAGVVTTFTIPGISDVSPRAINNLGQIAGHYTAGIQHGFFRDADGTLTYPIDYPLAGANTDILGLNDRGLMVGLYYVGSGPIHAFVVKDRTHFISYDYPGGAATVFGGINNSNAICGHYAHASSGFSHAFIARLTR
jgi:uncharacterized membrane protein